MASATPTDFTNHRWFPSRLADRANIRAKTVREGDGYSEAERAFALRVLTEPRYSRGAHDAILTFAAARLSSEGEDPESVTTEAIDAAVVAGFAALATGDGSPGAAAALAARGQGQTADTGTTATIDRAAMQLSVRAVAPDLALNDPNADVSRLAAQLADASTGDRELERVTSIACLLVHPFGQVSAEGQRVAAREAVARAAGQPANELDLTCYSYSAPPAGNGAGTRSGGTVSTRDDDFRREYRQAGGAKVLYGLTEEQYVSSRHKDEGLEPIV